MLNPSYSFYFFEVEGMKIEAVIDVLDGCKKSLDNYYNELSRDTKFSDVKRREALDHLKTPRVYFIFLIYHLEKLKELMEK